MSYYHVCKRAIFEHFQVSICTDFLPVPSQKIGSTADCLQEVDTGECLHYLRRLPTLLQHSSIFSRISGVRSSTLATPGKHMAE